MGKKENRKKRGRKRSREGRANLIKAGQLQMYTFTPLPTTIVTFIAKKVFEYRNNINEVRITKITGSDDHYIT